MIKEAELVPHHVYLGVHNRNGGAGDKERWDQAAMVWSGQHFFEETAIKAKGHPPSPFGYFDPDSPYATFIPIRDTGRVISDPYW